MSSTSFAIIAMKLRQAEVNIERLTRERDRAVQQASETVASVDAEGVTFPPDASAVAALTSPRTEARKSAGPRVVFAVGVVVGVAIGGPEHYAVGRPALDVEGEPMRRCTRCGLPRGTLRHALACRAGGCDDPDPKALRALREVGVTDVSRVVEIAINLALARLSVTRALCDLAGYVETVAAERDRAIAAAESALGGRSGP